MAGRAKAPGTSQAAIEAELARAYAGEALHRNEGPKAALRRERLFYVVAAWITLGMALTGFRHFYFGGKGFGGNPLTHQIIPVILIHAFAMSSWTILLILQSHLILRGKLRQHRTWGWIGAGLAVAVVGLGATMGILSAHYNPQAYMMFTGPKFFLVEMLTEIALFGALVAYAVTKRNRPEIHRPFILTATVVLSSGALARVPLIDFLAATRPLYAYGPVLTFGVLLYLLKLWMTRRHDRWFATGIGIVTIVFLISLPIGRSAAWQSLWGDFIA